MPPIVQKSNNDSENYTTISGTRRILAAKEAGLDEIICLVQEPNEDAEAAHQAFKANRHGKSFTSIEEAKHYNRMQIKYGFTMEKIGKKYGMAKLVADKKLSVSQTKTKVYRHKRNKKRENELQNDAANIPDIEISNIHFKSSDDMSLELEDAQVHMSVTNTPWAVGEEFEKGSTTMSIFDDIKPVLDECARVLCSKSRAAPVAEKTGSMTAYTAKQQYNCYS